MKADSARSENYDIKKEENMGSITLEHVTKKYGSQVVIPSLDLEIEDGQFVVFVGPSGCGKSTLLRLIAGLEATTDGIIKLDGIDVTNTVPGARQLSMVFQSYALYPHMSVYKNIAYPLKMAKADRSTIDQKVRAAAKMLDLTDYLDRRPGQLSGGQRQRVAIGRAIVREPKAFLFDEPLSNLDAALRVNMRLEISELHQQLKTTMVYVTHDQVEAMTLADKIVVLNAGRIEQVGAPLELYQNPANRFVAGFIGSPKMNFVEGSEAKKQNADALGIRPEHLKLSTTGGLWAGTVGVSEHLGSDTFVHVTTENVGILTARVNGEVPLQHGERVFLTPKRGKVHRFCPKGLILSDER